MLKLYVWEGVFTDYTDGIAFALAASPEQARELIHEHMGYGSSELDTLDPKVYDTPVGFGLWGGS